MISLLQKYKQWLACFLAGLLCVLFSSTAFAKQPQVSTSIDVAVALQQQESLESSYARFAASHLEPNFYQ